MSTRLTISKFAPLQVFDSKDSERVETFKTFSKKRFRKLQEEESPLEKIGPQNIQLRSGQIPFKRSFQKPKEDLIDIRKFQICELWSYKYNHIVQKVSRLNAVNEYLQVLSQEQKKKKQNKTLCSLDQIPNNNTRSSDHYKLKTVTSDATLPKIETVTTFQNSTSQNRRFSNSQYSIHTKEAYKDKLKQLIDSCDVNCKFYSLNKFSKI